MKVILAKHHSLCFGVRDAIAQATRLATAAPLTILGELVHNPVVRQQLASAGVREGDLSAPGSAPTGQVMITAHGASDAARRSWRAAGYGVADGTCPLVRHAHAQLQILVGLGFHPVIIGKRGHVEVNGLTGDFPGAIVIEEQIHCDELPHAARLGVISQTTQPIARVLTLVQAVQLARPQSEVRFVDTVCQPTKNRQTALQELIEEAETIVVVGGRNSNNTLQLVAAAESAGRRVFHVQSAGDLRPEWFEGTETIGLTAGTSTLKETVAEVAERLREFSAAAIACSSSLHA